MRFSDELEELNTCRCQATLPSELYAFLKGWLRWGSEPSPDNVAAVTSLDYDHEVRSRVRAGISIAFRGSEHRALSQLCKRSWDWETRQS